MKTTVALVIALVILVSYSANAAPLRITGGTLVVHEEIPLMGVTFFGGTPPFDFGVFGAFQENVIPASAAFFVDPFEMFMEFNNATGDTLVQVGSWTCEPQGDLEFGCGRIDLTSRGFVIPTDWPRDTPFVATVPFFATGVLCVHDIQAGPSAPYCVAGEPQFDIVGSGTVTGTLCLDVPLSECGLRLGQTFFEPARLVYTFTVAEPPTLFLVTLAFVMTIGGLAFVRRRAAVNR